MKEQEVLRCLEARAEEIRRRFAVSRLSIFGSVAREDASEASDLDVLVVFEGNARFDRFMDLKFFLEDELGMDIDLVTEPGLRPELRATIEGEAIRVA